MVHGSVELVSPWFSNRWRVIADGRELATLQRFGRIHVSTVTLPDGTRWILEPHGQSVVRAIDGIDHEFARITRESWWGRHWAVTGPGFSYELTSHPIPRRWTIEVGGAPVAGITGSLVSYNRVRLDTTLSVPLIAALLSWHVIARPWEAAAAPGALVPAPREAPPHDHQL